MSANTKIVVLRSREVLYTILLLFVGILIILVLLSLFLPSDSASLTAWQCRRTAASHRRCGSYQRN